MYNAATFNSIQYNYYHFVALAVTLIVTGAIPLTAANLGAGISATSTTISTLTTDPTTISLGQSPVTPLALSASR